MTAGSLTATVGAFVDELTAILDGLTARPGSYRNIVMDEADAVVGSMLAADGRISEAEAEAYARAVGRFVRRNGRPVDAVTASISDQVLRRRGWAAKPSELFSLLVEADARSGTLSSHRYYQHAMECAQAAADVDAVFTARRAGRDRPAQGHVARPRSTGPGWRARRRATSPPSPRSPSPWPRIGRWSSPGCSRSSTPWSASVR